MRQKTILATLALAMAAASLVACATSRTEEELAGPDPAENESASVDAGVADEQPASEDVSTFSRMLVGEESVDDGLREVSERGGWPIRDGDEFLFVKADDGHGPYRLAGDHNGWGPESMTPGPGFFWARVAISAPQGSGYKFVDGDGLFVADPLARRYDYDEFGELSLVRSDAAHLERWLMPETLGLAQRELHVFLPAEPITHHLYVHDGQNVFSPSAPHGGWQLQQSLPAGMLVVAIDNSPQRMAEYTPFTDDIGGGEIGGLGDVYAAYVEEHVRPHIEATYGSSDRVGVLGSSLGGLISLHIADLFPGRYQFVGSMSGTLGWGSLGLDGETIIDSYREAGHRSLLVYLDSGGHDGGGCVDNDGDGLLDDSSDADNYCTTRQMADELADVGYEFGVDMWHWYEPDAPHSEAAWAVRVSQPLSLFATEVN